MVLMKKIPAQSPSYLLYALSQCPLFCSLYNTACLNHHGTLSSSVESASPDTTLVPPVAIEPHSMHLSVKHTQLFLSNAHTYRDI